MCAPGIAIGTIMLFVTTIYNLFLAHIWPVTIHFGDYSLANAIYILVSVLTSLVVAYLTFYLAICYLLSTIVRGIFWFMLTPEQRARKRSRLERTIYGIGFFFLLPLYSITKWQERRKPPVRSEFTQHILEKLQQTQSKNEEKQ
jgi:hypothetical protein